MESVFVIAAVVGATEFIKRAYLRDVVAAATILSAAVIGILAGVLGIEGLTLQTGLVAGLSAAGVYKVATKI